MSEQLICSVCPVKGLAEVWRAFPLATQYEVSTLGRVRRTRDWRVLRPSANADGYMLMNLARPHRSSYVHRLVALTWLGDPPADGRVYEVDHLDFDRANNALSNLRWLPKDTNAWRWKFFADEPPDEWVEDPPLTAEQLAQHYAAWPSSRPRVRKPHETHRHLNVSV